MQAATDFPRWKILNFRILTGGGRPPLNTNSYNLTWQSDIAALRQYCLGIAVYRFKKFHNSSHAIPEDRLTTMGAPFIFTEK